MPFAVGDKIVHPKYGPGRITAEERRGIFDEPKLYFVLEIPGADLTVYVPKPKMGSIGVRPAMSQAKMQRILGTLNSKPRHLPDDYRERQDEVWEELKTGRPLRIAQVVRDLAWHQHREHLTKKDKSYLERAITLLAGEMALVLGSDPADMSALIDTTLSSALPEPEH